MCKLFALVQEASYALQGASNASSGAVASPTGSFMCNGSSSHGSLPQQDMSPPQRNPLPQVQEMCEEDVEDVEEEALQLALEEQRRTATSAAGAQLREQCRVAPLTALGAPPDRVAPHLNHQSASDCNSTSFVHYRLPDQIHCTPRQRTPPEIDVKSSWSPPATPELAPTQADAAVAQLEIILPVINGMVYSMHAYQLTILQQPHGLAPLFTLFCNVVPLGVQEHALHVLVNVTFGKRHEVQNLAREQGALEAVQQAALLAHARGGSTPLALACTVLCNLTDSCTESCVQFVRSAEVIELLVRLCDGSMLADDEVCTPAAELFLALFQSREARPELLRAGGMQCLEEMAAASSSELVSAKAKQALQEHQGACKK